MTQWKTWVAGTSEAQTRQSDSYLYAQDSTGFATTGVLGGLAVSQTTTASGSVIVGMGSAVVQSSLTAGAARLNSNANETVDVFGPSPMGGLPRYDLVIFNADTGKIEVVPGTANAAPTDPNVSANHIKLARIRNAANATTIPNSAIDDLRKFTRLAGTGSPWMNFTPRLWHNMSTTPVAIGANINSARYCYLTPNTVQANVDVSRQAGLTTVGGFAVDLPVPAARRVLNCGTLYVFGTGGSTAPADQTGVAYMEGGANPTRLIPVRATQGWIDVAPLVTVRYSVTYEV